jgi:hypothetical protein
MNVFVLPVLSFVVGGCVELWPIGSVRFFCLVVVLDGQVSVSARRLTNWKQTVFSRTLGVVVNKACKHWVGW